MIATHTGDAVASKVSTPHTDVLLDDEERELTVRDAAKEILIGSAAGMVSEVVEYPFDLAKVRLQAQLLAPSSSQATRFNGPLHCLMQTWRDEGFRGLYRGIPAPLAGSMAETATLFVAYTSFQRVIRKLSGHFNYQKSSSEPLSMLQTGIAAAGAGFVASFVLTPIELVKCRMQVQMMNFHPPPKFSTPAPGRIPTRTSNPFFMSTSHNTPSKLESTHPGGRSFVHNYAHRTITLPHSFEAAKPPGSMAIIRSVINSTGVRGLWLGHTGTILRETGGSAAWFVAKEWVARRFVTRRIQQDPDTFRIVNGTTYRVPRTISNTELLPWESAISGAVAGALGALLFYPADTIKSAIQTEAELRPKTAGPKPASTFIGTFRRMWVRHGIKGLYAGCGMTVARAIPSSGIIFVVYDGLSAYFSSV
ncbi:mitochondrial carrier domain-containing protein [Panaeolus papilionaceus]|nr:mitochondrial carrier domain-containing protein [Panaeolus papilionaceus]